MYRRSHPCMDSRRLSQRICHPMRLVPTTGMRSLTWVVLMAVNYSLLRNKADVLISSQVSETLSSTMVQKQNFWRVRYALFPKVQADLETLQAQFVEFIGDLQRILAPHLVWPCLPCAIQHIFTSVFPSVRRHARRDVQPNVVACHRAKG